MNPEFERRVRRVFDLVVDLDGAELEETLAAFCEGDDDLHRAVTRLLQAHARDAESTEFLGGSPAGREESAALPERIGDVRVLSRLGRGGRGVVYLGQRGPRDELVAVKVLQRIHAATPHHAERFRREIAAVYKLDHANIVRGLDDGVHEGVPYVILEYVRGHDLGTDLTLARGPDGSSSRLLESGPKKLFERAARIALDVAEALAYAHGQGVMHRDVKPQNILIDDQRLVARLTDFGLARDDNDQTMTGEGDVEGTPHYMSPEQVYARRSLPIDGRTDVYSLGVVLYEMLTRERPFGGDTAREVMHDITSRIPTRVRRHDPAVPADLETICHKAMEKRPQDRFQTARAMADDLRRFLEHQAIAAAPPSALRLALRRLQRHRVPLGFVGVALMGSLGTLMGSDIYEGRQQHTAVVDALNDRVAQIEAGDNLEDPEDGELLQRCEALAADGGMGEQTAALERQLREHYERTVAELQRRTDAAMAGRKPRTSFDERVFATDETATLLTQIMAEARYTGSDRTLQELASPLLTQLSLEIQSPDPETPCRVAAHVVDAITGRQAPAPFVTEWAPADGVLRFDVPPGHYRLRITQAGGRLAELDRDLSAAGSQPVERVVLRSADDLHGRPMVVIPGATFTREEFVGRDPRLGTQPERFEVDVAPFRMDVSPVTNGDYEAFLRDTGHPPPRMWRDIDRPADWAERPVAWVTLDDARAYAEWAGKRLPTLSEWLLAAGGPERLRFPWGDEPGDAIEQLVFDSPGQPIGPNATDEVVQAWYTRWVPPVGRTPDELRGPYGLDGLLGPLWEWTATPDVEFVDGSLVASTGVHYRAGSSCQRSSVDVRARGLADLTSVKTSVQHTDTGFRCVRSLLAD